MSVVFLKQASACQAGMHRETTQGMSRYQSPSKPKQGRSVMSPQWNSPSYTHEGTQALFSR